MPVDVRTEITIRRPREAVFAYASDPDNAPAWYVNIRSVEWLTPPPLRIGSRLAFVAHFLGRRLAYTYEIIELRAPEQLVMRTAAGPFPMETTYEVHALAADASRMMLRNRGEPRGFARVAAPLVAMAMRRANRADLWRLKSILERPAPTEARRPGARASEP